MDEISLFTAIEPPPPDDADSIRTGARARLAAAMVSPQRAAARRRSPYRRLAVRAVVACATATLVAAVAVAVTYGASGIPARPGVGAAQARTVAYVIHRVEKALTGQNLVYLGQTTAGDGTPSTTWAYGRQHRWEQGFAGKPYSDEGTALIDGKRVSVYVLYPDRKWAGSPGWRSPSQSACSMTAALEMGGIPIPTDHWSNFINSTLACGAATVTGHVQVNGMETTKITGTPVTVRLSQDYAKLVGEKWARARWALYVSPKTYLPVRITGSTETFGGPRGGALYSTVTDVQWLPPTAANIANTLVTIPTGFHRVASAADV
jgi:hypothetical protein